MLTLALLHTSWQSESSHNCLVRLDSIFGTNAISIETIHCRECEPILMEHYCPLIQKILTWALIHNSCRSESSYVTERNRLKSRLVGTHTLINRFDTFCVILSDVNGASLILFGKDVTHAQGQLMVWRSGKWQVNTRWLQVSVREFQVKFKTF